MRTLTDIDVRFVVSRLPRDIQKLMVEEPVYLGGGFIRETIAGGVVKDIDLFGPSKTLLKALMDDLAEVREGSRVFTTDNAITLLTQGRLPVQAITKWTYSDPMHVAESFDFTVCQAVIWYDQGFKSLCHDDFYSDLAAKRLIYTSPVREEAPGGSMMRVKKFLQRGYNIQPVALAEVMARVAAGVHDIERLDTVERARVIAGLLLEVDPMSVVDGVEFRED